MTATTFGDLSIGERFHLTPYDKTEWRKGENREARMVGGYRIELMHEEMTVWKPRR